MNKLPIDEGFHIRPRFQMITTKTKEELFECIKSRLEVPNSPISGKLRLGYISLFPKKENQHYWSPHLSITIDEIENEDKRILYGLYGPMPSVWSMFIFFYAILIFALLMVAVIGFSNRSIGNSSMILWLSPILILAIGSLFLVSYFGQKKGHDQVEIIHRFLMECLGEVERV